MASKTIRNMKKSIRDFRIADNADIKGDFNAVSSQLAAITANLRTSGKGITQALTQDQARQVAALRRINTTATRAGTRVNRRTQRQMTNDYGSAVGGAAGRAALAPAKAALSGTLEMGRRGVVGGNMLANSGKVAMRLGKQGSAEAASAAEYAMAVALKSRNMESAAQVAEMQFRLDEQILAQEHALELAEQAHQNQLELYEMEKEDAAKEARGSWNQVYASGGQIAGAMATMDQMPIYELNGEEVAAGTAGAKITGYRKLGVAERAQMYAVEHGIMGADGVPTDPEKWRLILEISTNMEQGMNANEASRAAMGTLYGDEKGFKLQRANEAVQTGVRASHMTFIGEVMRQLAQGGESLTQSQFSKLIVLLRGYKETQIWADYLNDMAGQGDDALIFEAAKAYMRQVEGVTSLAPTNSSSKSGALGTGRGAYVPGASNDPTP